MIFCDMDGVLVDFDGSFEVIEEVSRRLGVPVMYVSGTKEILAKLNVGDELKFPMELFMKLPFDALA